MKSGSKQREPQDTGHEMACLKNRKLASEKWDIENKEDGVSDEVRR